MNSRRKGRELILQFLYQYEMNKECLWEENLKIFFKKKTISPELMIFIRKTLEGTIANIKEIDVIIKKQAKNWELTRIALVDKNVLRIAIYEMVFLKDIPPVVSINEAVDIVKKFSSPESGKFVNGILDEVKREYIS